MNSDLKLNITAPSNIALVKYWGKKDGQLPQNSSISMTLNNCTTTFECEVWYENSENLTLDFLFHGAENEAFKNRILKTLNSWKIQRNWLQHAKFKINATNSFPHSAGIASSASAFAALATLVECAEVNFYNREFDSEAASSLARQGSGSACRSITGNYNIWGKNPEIPHSSDDYAVNFNQFHKNFADLQDVICIVSQKTKSVSSSAGHGTMIGHPFASARYEMANKNVAQICHAMTHGDWNIFGRIVEHEALTLHALMMSSDRPYILLCPESLVIIQKVWDFREETRCPLYFTIDAGPNIHLLFPGSVKAQVQAFIHSEILPLCENNQVIADHIGHGVLVEYH